LRELTEEECEYMQESELLDMRIALGKNERFIELTGGSSVHFKLLRHMITVEQDLRVIKWLVRYMVAYGDRQAGKHFSRVIDWSDEAVSTALLTGIMQSVDPSKKCPSAEAFDKLHAIVSRTPSCNSNRDHLQLAVQYAVRHLLIGVGQWTDDHVAVGDSEEESPCSHYLAPLFARLYAESQWETARVNLRSINERLALTRPRRSLADILASALSIYTQHSADVVFDQMKSAKWPDKEAMIAGLSAKLDFVLRSDVISQLASDPTEEAVNQFQNEIRPAVERGILHRLSTVHRGMSAFRLSPSPCKSPRPFLVSGKHSSLMGFLPATSNIELPPMLAYGSIAGDDGAVIVAGFSDALTLVHRSDIGRGKGKDMPDPTAREMSNAVRMVGRTRRLIQQDTVEWFGGTEAIAAIQYMKSEAQGAYLLAWGELVEQKGGSPALNKFLRNKISAGHVRSAKVIKVLDVLFPRTVSEDTRHSQFLEHIIYASRINVDTVLTTGKEAQAALALGLRQVLAQHGGSEGVFKAMNKAGNAKKLAFVNAIFRLCQQPAHAVLGTAYGRICQRIIHSINTYSHCFALMGSLAQVSEVDRGTLNDAQRTEDIPKQELYKVCSGDGLGGSFSAVFEVLGGGCDGTVEAELYRCSKIIRACGINPQNVVMVRLIHWLVREIEDPEIYRSLHACHQIVLLPYSKVQVAHSDCQEDQDTPIMVADFFRDLSGRFLCTTKDSVWSDAHFAVKVATGVDCGFGNWMSWTPTDRGAPDMTCNAVTTCVLAQVNIHVRYLRC
jgi:hypothetical protein